MDSNVSIDSIVSSNLSKFIHLIDFQNSQFSVEFYLSDLC
jgi:hypothetical protein